MAETANSEEDAGVSLKDQGNDVFKAGNYFKAAAVYTQAMETDPSNPTLYSNRSAAFLHLVKLSKALADAEMTITLNPQWEKGYFRKGCVLEAMERYDDAIAAFQVALQHNAQSTDVSRKIKRLTQLAKEKKRVKQVENIRSNVNMKKYLGSMKSELTMESAMKGWHETGKLDAKVNFLLNNEKTQTDKYAPVVNVDKMELISKVRNPYIVEYKDSWVEKGFESPDTHSSCFSFLRQYAEESVSWAACLVVSKNSISYPQVWKGQGWRKWKQGQSDGFFVQFESPIWRKLWFVPSSTEKGQLVCQDPEDVDVTAHQVLPRIFKRSFSNS